MRKFESVEVTQGNTTGKAGTPSIPFGRGYYQSGNNGSFGIQFTPSGEPSFKTYKSMKHSKKNIKRMKKFKDYVKESMNINEIEIIDISFYDDFNGFVRFTANEKNMTDHFRIYPYGNIAFDNFYSEEIYLQLVAYVYENLPEGKLKINVEGYYELTPLTEDACATLGNTGGMGNVVAAQPSSTPGDVAGSKTGSGDIGQPFGVYMKKPAKWSNKKKKIKSFKNFSPIN